MTYDRIMIDLETMGGPPDGAIVAIGACFFNMEKLEIGPSFYQAVHLQTAVNIGMKIEADTVMWWLRQTKEAQLGLFRNRITIERALIEFAAFVEQHSRAQDVHTYGNGASFDLTILSTAYKLANIERPWRFGRERCFRTIRNQYPSVVYDTDQRPGTHHNAADDAEYQARHLFAIKESRRG